MSPTETLSLAYGMPTHNGPNFTKPLWNKDLR